MRFLLDENFPLGLLRVLQSDGWDADHIITLAWRGASDQRIRERLRDPQIVFFTHDDDFLFGETVAAVIVLSRVRQSRRAQAGFYFASPTTDNPCAFALRPSASS